MKYSLVFLLSLAIHANGYRLQYRDCEGSVRHVHLAVGPDPSSSMTVSFSSIPAESGDEVYGAVLIGRDPHRFEQVITEDERPIFYTSPQPRDGKNYTSPYQHHITIIGLRPHTTYHYMCVTRSTMEEILELQENVDLLQLQGKQSQGT
ncbi:hypothetical protein MHU86_9838 [Fragilaria crotonensis]|nr:hypothetical protein MHU86_9838 [Fragilaria crotonensis]